MLGIVEARVAQCAAAGFDGVEFDVVDAYAQGAEVTGWEISYETQLEYDQQLANLAHRYGLTAALKNDLGQLEALLPYFDYAVNEQCFQFDECDGYAAWIAAGKAVFRWEYRIGRRRFMQAANAAGFGRSRRRAASRSSRRPGSRARSEGPWPHRRRGRRTRDQALTPRSIRERRPRPVACWLPSAEARSSSSSLVVSSPPAGAGSAHWGLPGAPDRPRAAADGGARTPLC
jgi:hypothetical protein